MIKIITNTIQEQEQVKEALMDSETCYKFDGSCPRDKSNRLIKCSDCINYNIKWEVRN